MIHKTKLANKISMWIMLACVVANIAMAIKLKSFGATDWMWFTIFWTVWCGVWAFMNWRDLKAKEQEDGRTE